jgi:hypothetical protein
LHALGKAEVVLPATPRAVNAPHAGARRCAMVPCDMS